MSWLVTGGAGYIGAHVVRALLGGGESVVVYDDLSTGSADRVPEGVPLVVGSVVDRDLLEQAIRDHAVTGVVHIAAKKQVGESVERPLHYYRENVTGLQTLLEAMTATGVDKLVFSSSAAVYGMPDVALVTEDTPCAPMSPYGETKLIGEWLIKAAAAAHGIRGASLRYFNVAGAASPELSDAGVFNLVPMVFERLEAGEAPRIFGDDYATPDGTCVRDYIHVQDIASAHLAAARYLVEAPQGTALTLNIGRGEGSSVREMVDRILKVTGNETVAPEVTARRAGDPARVVASADRIREVLGWSARHGLDEMIESAWQGWRHRRG
ncbi:MULTISPECIES: UDP-glucose 4-epimerase GalE [Streptomyces]|jgi:UDP-glucose 4-epimerase|uniref:UDP-glucose 4-epimerase n=2 Tax=Streptomyces TaxID=1883 RepID=A0A514K166_9ACTN|nr:MULTISPECIES: UDP-glucose 4-epimerase GalE [Streptomyces]MBA8942699.1 UDP-glucose 4-epimerase [Streptomyces calvus]MYS30360.1 UDP-glucose 4-epimerase GalE [Streptomyces sp. SID7804]QDI73406.1 UDP-glucose 4-epimerase GalE [Streptomyces calvus]GGP83469.1 UDP-glucose 4-epimerase GalE [Streptomyces calvus]